MSNRYALLVACDRYEDPSLHGLLAPRKDAEALAEVLSHPEWGKFAVTTRCNEPSHVIERELERLCRTCAPDDTLLLYFSCHGLKDDRGELVFAMPNTHRATPHSSSVPAQHVHNYLDRCRARQQILILDCCYSGAYGHNMRPKAVEDQPLAVNTGKYFTPNYGNGLFVLTATDSISQSYEKDGVSLFTQVIVEGLRTGSADLDRDGQITMDELHAYVHREMIRRQLPQRPRKWALNVEGYLRITDAPPVEDGKITLPGRKRSAASRTTTASDSREVQPVATRRPRRSPEAANGATDSADRIEAAAVAAPAPKTRSGRRRVSASPAASSQSVPPVSVSLPMPGVPSSGRRRYTWAVPLVALVCGGFAGGRLLYTRQQTVSSQHVAAISAPPVAAPAPSAITPLEAEKPTQPLQPPAPAETPKPTTARIPGGDYELGSQDRVAQNPLHTVTLSAFEIDLTEVTVAAYEVCFQKRQCTAPMYTGTSGYCNWAVSGREEHPVNCLSFEQAQAYCKWQGKRLPTEDEWEAAARGPNGGRYPWGEEPPAPTLANTCGPGCKRQQNKQVVTSQIRDAEADGAMTTAPVGNHPAGRSAFGLHDVAGNVWEWAEPRHGLNTDRRPALGGSWQSPSPVHFRADRRHTERNGQWAHTGFRCVRTLDSQAK
ncbi:MAG: SUMF1/EgtB/PvdO family nonheme iron enzyme [Myxococcales bacterium]|nr:SUMF1/EgtB/PvdO family nonheme iron enzyme [Myxococcales bacterium]